MDYLNTYSTKLLYLLICSLFPVMLFAQEQDAELWTSIAIDKKLPENWNVNLESQSRFIENFSTLGITFLDAGISYKINNYIKVAFNDRLIYSPIRNSKNRIYFDAAFRKNIIERLRLSYRIRYQLQYEKYESVKKVIRNKIQLTYNIPKMPLNPYVAAELYYQFNNMIVYSDNEVITYHEFNNYRLQLGVEWKISTKSTMNLYYIKEKEFNVANPDISNIIGVGYVFQL